MLSLFSRLSTVNGETAAVKSMVSGSRRGCPGFAFIKLCSPSEMLGEMLWCICARSEHTQNNMHQRLQMVVAYLMELTRVRKKARR